MKNINKDSNSNLINLATEIVDSEIIQNNITKNDIIQAHLDLIYNLKLILEIKDAYTLGHSERVSQYAVLIGKEIGLNNEDLEILKTGALIHDIGKLGIDDTILNSTSRLTDKEFNEIKTHPTLGTQILGDSEVFKNLIPIIKGHHEKYDGTGYPNKLKAEEIPLLARIVSVADTFDAMTSSRSYRKALSNEIAKEEIIKCSGTQFCPKIAKAMINILENNETEILKIQSKISHKTPEMTNVTDRIIEKISKEQLFKKLEINKDNNMLSNWLNNKLILEQILINIYLEHTNDHIINKQEFKEKILFDLKIKLSKEFNFKISESLTTNINNNEIKNYLNIKNKAEKKVQQIQAMQMINEFNNTYKVLLQNLIKENNIEQIIILKMTKQLLNNEGKKEER